MRTRFALPLALALLATLAPSALAQPRTCGVERWNVKTLQDPDAAAVVRDPEPTTIGALIGVPKEPNRPQNGRTSFERRVFRVRGIILETRPVQADGDIHLVLGDPADRARFLVAEIPNSACALASRYASDFAEVRRLATTLPEGIEVEVEGVDFWDDNHGQLGAVAVRQSDVRMWVSTAPRVCHCPGCVYLGETRRGEYMSESAAVRAGARTAGAKRNRSRMCSMGPSIPRRLATHHASSYQGV